MPMYRYMLGILLILLNQMTCFILMGVTSYCLPRVRTPYVRCGYLMKGASALESSYPENFIGFYGCY